MVKRKRTRPNEAELKRIYGADGYSSIRSPQWYIEQTLAVNAAAEYALREYYGGEDRAQAER